MKAAVRVENLGKQYVLGGAEQIYGSFREMITGVVTTPFQKYRKLKGAVNEEDKFWALRDVNFEIEPGEVTGIIGRNGAGKSTLLRILSRITCPTEGRAILSGKVASLLEVGTGFHAELTGRENIYLNGTILGMTRRQIRSRFDEIVSFAEIEAFLDTPVKRYSSGMYVRLAFSVAAHLDPDILIVDEVLAVGDAAFQNKCLKKLGSASKEGRTVLFVSHNLKMISALCDSCIVLNKGKLLSKGNVIDQVNLYLSQLSSETELITNVEEMEHHGPIVINNVRVRSTVNNSSVIKLGDDVAFEFNYKADDLSGKAISFGFSLQDITSGEYVLVYYSEFNNVYFYDVNGKGTIRCVVDRFPVVPGKYLIACRVVSDNREIFFKENIGTTVIREGDYYGTGRLGHRAEELTKVLIHGNWEHHHAGVAIHNDVEELG
jgi:lipopolysaccharide transport system ATP-binding protein